MKNKNFYMKNFVAIVLRNLPLNYDYEEISVLLNN